MEAEIIKILKELIDSRQVSEVAKKAGLSRMQIYRILKGESSPTLKNLESLCKAVGLKIVLQRKT